MVHQSVPNAVATCNGLPVGDIYWSLWLPRSANLPGVKKCLNGLGVDEDENDIGINDYDSIFGELENIGSFELKGVNMKNKKLKEKVRAHFMNRQLNIPIRSGLLGWYNYEYIGSSDFDFISSKNFG